MNSERKQSLVSVLVMAYNHEAYIAQCLNSILNQKTNFLFEIILGEDFSSDTTRDICFDFAEKYPEKIKLFLRLRKDVIYINGSPTGRFNFIESLKSCTGKYVALCDGDDYWTDPLKLQKQVGFLETNPDYNICFHEVGIFNQSENKIINNTITRKVLETTDINELAKGNYIHTPSVVFRNNFALPDWFSNSSIGDWSLYMILVKDKKIKKFEDVMAVYRVHGDSLWSLKSEETRILNTINGYKSFLNSNNCTNSETKKILKASIKDLERHLPKKSTFIEKIFNKIKKRI
ncbi:glycosyltransferase [Flavobacteriaceae bacterium S0825]|uniref:glycosyltransferase family 2 protein n=1 Tax=Gaetbulibacter sp. S0825 TaxID=2720084 RepID=UPI001431CE63|nr:glycosyltransferase [Gaetbulibacter sp. S0825]MCK0109021.1 glycosyltransferase [Flavobacteriaceae bacterium S0825]NIX64656.1 glycosyltransferase [Gaetbulibacter sp. S0825]